MVYPFLRTIAIALAMVLLGGLLYWQLSEPSGSTPPLSSWQEDVVRANIAADQQAAAQYETQATGAESAAQKSYVSGQAISRMAREYHRQTYPKHAPLSATPSPAAVDSLQRFLATY
jgi:hypothetical protein